MVEQGFMKQAVDVVWIDCCLKEASDEHSHGLVLDIVHVEPTHEGWSEQNNLLWFFKLIREEPALSFTVYTCNVSHPEVNYIGCVPYF